MERENNMKLGLGVEEDINRKNEIHGHCWAWFRQWDFVGYFNIVMGQVFFLKLILEV